MQFDRKSVASWESLHLELFKNKIPIEEIDVNTYCRYLQGDIDSIKAEIFGPDVNDNYTCADLIMNIWQGIRNMSIHICPSCHDLLRTELSGTPVILAADVLGWSNINLIIDELIRFITTDMLYNFMMNRLGISFVEASHDTIVCGYSGSQNTIISGWFVIPIFCSISESSYLSNEFLRTMCLLRILHHMPPFVTIGLSYESALSNVANELLIEYIIQTFAAITLQTTWRRRKERKQLFSLGFVLHRKTGILQENLKMCYKHFAATSSKDISLVHKIIFDD